MPTTKESLIPRIVLTGGPGGGKTTTLNYLRENYPSLYIEPEAATIVLQSGFPVPNEERPWTYEWQLAFQEAVRGVQLGLDDLADVEAPRVGAEAIIQDRSHVDAAVYYKNIKAYEIHAKTKLIRQLGRASIVFFLPTFAGTPNFDPRANPHRFEEQQTMIELSNNLEEIWKAHPRLYKIEASTVENRALIIGELIETLIH
jgi:predicted ATPase